jgi:uncharacterized membrane protein
MPKKQLRGSRRCKESCLSSFPDSTGQDTPAQIEANPPQSGNVIAAMSMSWGPLPTPEALEQYERLVPGSAHQIVAWVTDEKAHRHKSETDQLALAGTELNVHAAGFKRGQWMGFILLIFLVCAAIYCAVIGQVLVALAFVGASAFQVISDIVNAPKKQNKE